MADRQIASGSYGAARRRLLRQGLTLAIAGRPLSSIGNTSPPQPRADGAKTQLLELDQDSVRFHGSEEFLSFRRGLAAFALNPELREWMDVTHGDQRDYAERNDCRFWALLEVEDGRHGQRRIALLDYLDGPAMGDQQSLKRRQRFLHWLDIFKPRTRDDWLMALPLYERHVAYDVSPPTASRARFDPWLDSILSGTRGMLFWRYQLDELVGVVGRMGHVRAVELTQCYLKRIPSAETELRSLHYLGTGQSLLQIIEERTPVGGPSRKPDYVVAERLGRHFAGNVLFGT